MAQPEAAQALRVHMRDLAEYERRLKELNSQRSRLHNEKKVISDAILDIIKQPGFQQPGSPLPERIRLETENIAFRIVSPGGYKSWGPTKGDLQRYLRLHLGNNAGDACFNFVVERHRAENIVQDYSIVPVNN
jgi:hypothetical protein